MCPCCQFTGEKSHCRCVISLCRRCAPRCLRCCVCPARHARNCGDDTDTHDALDTELSDPSGPFADIAEPNPKPYNG